MAYRLRLFANVNLMQKWDLLRTFNNIFFFCTEEPYKPKKPLEDPQVVDLGKQCSPSFQDRATSPLERKELECKGKRRLCQCIVEFYMSNQGRKMFRG